MTTHAPPARAAIPPPSATMLALEAIAGKLDLCIARVEVGAKSAELARDEAIETRKSVELIKRAVHRLQSDHVSLRHGIPASWTGRFAIVAVAASVGAMLATTVIACSGGLRPPTAAASSAP